MSEGKTTKTVGESEEVQRAATNAFVEATFDNQPPEDAPEVVKQAVAKGKKVICIEDGYERMERFYLLMPTPQQLNLFVETSGFRKKPLIAIKRLLKERALSPDADTLMARLENEPMLGTALFDKVNEALGGNREFDVRTFWSNSG